MLYFRKLNYWIRFPEAPLKRKRFTHASKGHKIPAHERRDIVRTHLQRIYRAKKDKNESLLEPRNNEITALSQACISFAHKCLDILNKYKTPLFAAYIDLAAPTYPQGEFLRRDYRFLFERLSWRIKKGRKHDLGILVLDRSETNQLRRLCEELSNFCTNTQVGYTVSQYILPTPFFVDSALTPLVQIADLCIYIANWSVRPSTKFTEPVRPDLFSLSKKVSNMDQKIWRDNDTYPHHSLFYLDSLIDPRDQKKAKHAKKIFIEKETQRKLKNQKEYQARLEKKRGLKTSSSPMRRQLPDSATKSTEQLELF